MRVGRGVSARTAQLPCRAVPRAGSAAACLRSALTFSCRCRGCRSSPPSPQSPAGARAPHDNSSSCFSTPAQRDRPGLGRRPLAVHSTPATHRDPVRVLVPDARGLGLALLCMQSSGRRVSCADDRWSPAAPAFGRSYSQQARGRAMQGRPRLTQRVLVLEGARGRHGARPWLTGHARRGWRTGGC